MKARPRIQDNETTRSAKDSGASLNQATSEPAFADNRPAAAVQRKLVESASNGPRMLAQRRQLPFGGGSASQVEVVTSERQASELRVNNTGLPDQLKSGIENLSGMSMDHVKVHYNSPQPAQLNAHAYAQGSEIHVAPGQEKHLPHEAWHVVQQAQGRVKPTLQMAGAIVNDEQGLEREADAMGSQVTAGVPPQLARESTGALPRISHAVVAQRKISYNSGQFESEEDLLNALYKVFEAHGEKAKERIKYFVNEYEKTDYKVFGSWVFKKIVTNYMPKENFNPTFAVTGVAKKGTRHGPRMPEQINRNAKPNKEKVLGTFNFSSVTLGRLTVSNGGTEISFHDRQTKDGMHAEDNLLAQLEAYIEDNKIETKNLIINLTINNFFCTEETTTKAKGKPSCLEKIIEIQNRHKFSKFHVYFQNTYGEVTLMESSIKALQDAGILVSSFTSTEKKGPYVNKHLNPHSESEDDSDTEEDFKGEKSPYVNKHLEPHNDSEDDSDIEKEASLLEMAREYWQNEIEETMEQTNHQYVDQDGFEAVCYEDVEEFLKEKTESPFELDYVEDQKHLEEYMDEIAEAITEFIGKMIKKYA